VSAEVISAERLQRIRLKLLYALLLLCVVSRSLVSRGGAGATLLYEALLREAGQQSHGNQERSGITFEGDFLRQAAEDNAFLLEIARWTKDQGHEGDVRNIANELLMGETRLGDELRKFAAKKHVTLPDKLSEADSAARLRMESLKAQDVDQFFVEEAQNRYRQEITRFETEAQQGIDPDIKKWAAGGTATLERHQKLVTGSSRPPRTGS